VLFLTIVELTHSLTQSHSSVNLKLYDIISKSIDDIREAQSQAASVPHGPKEIRATPEDIELGVSYFTQNRDQIRSDLLTYGSIWFRGFPLMETVAGYRSMHEALGLEPCLDPLHSSGLRKFASERDALYEEVCIYIYVYIV
jgi:hypothetical protein